MKTADFLNFRECFYITKFIPAPAESQRTSDRHRQKTDFIFRPAPALLTFIVLFVKVRKELRLLFKMILKYKEQQAGPLSTTAVRREVLLVS